MLLMLKWSQHFGTKYCKTCRTLMMRRKLEIIYNPFDKNIIIHYLKVLTANKKERKAGSEGFVLSPELFGQGLHRLKIWNMTAALPESLWDFLVSLKCEVLSRQFFFECFILAPFLCLSATAPHLFLFSSHNHTNLYLPSQTSTVMFTRRPKPVFVIDHQMEWSGDEDDGATFID